MGKDFKDHMKALKYTYWPHLYKNPQKDNFEAHINKS